MQATLPLTPSHPVKALQGLARQIALPHEHAPLRFPSFPALERTAVMGFTQPTTFDVPASATRGMMVTRQAAYPVWGDFDINGRAYAVTYQADPVLVPTGSITALYPVTSGPFGYTATVRSNGIILPGLGGVTTTTPYPVLGMDSQTGPVPWTYVPPGAPLMVTVTNTAALPNSVTFIVTTQEWTSPGEVQDGSVQVSAVGGNTGGGALYATDSAGGRWVRPTNVSLAGAASDWPDVVYVTLTTGGGTLSYGPSASSAGLVTLTPSSVIAKFPVVFPAEFANSALPWYATRTTAAAVLATNVTQVLNKGGTVLCGRISPNVINPFRVQYSNITTLHPAEKAFMALETGFYTFVPPSTDMAAFWDYTSNTGYGSGSSVASTSTPLYRLDNDSLVHHVYFTSAGAATTLAITADWHIEFRTSSALFQIGMSNMTLETLHQAQLALASSGYFFENITHKQVLAAITSAAKKFGPVVANAVYPLLPTPAKYMAKAAQSLIYGKMGTPNATSAAASGMLAKPKPTPKPAKPKAKKKVVVARRK